MRVLYISHNEIDNGLVRSQVLPYLRGLAARGADIRLLTYERGGPFPAGEFPRERWTAVAARRGSGLLAKVLDVAAGTYTALRLARRHGSQIIHARSYLPAAVALLVATALGRKVIFDMRGFLPDEYVEVGHWRRGEPRDLIARSAERVLLARAAAIVCPTPEAEARLRSHGPYADLTRARPILVQPSMVDIDRFRPAVTRSEIPTLVYSGTLGTWYMLDEMLRVFAHARALEPRLRFLIVTRSPSALVTDAMRRTGVAAADVDVRAAGYAEVPALLAAAHVGIALVRQTPSKRWGSALKIAEYLACGLPVVLNEGLGGADRLVADAGAGHVVDRPDPAGLARAGEAVVRLLADEDARRRARGAAETHFDLERGVEAYARLYARVAGAAPA